MADDQGAPSSDAIRALVGDVPDGVLFVSPDGLVRYANGAVREVLGWEPAELVGRPLSELVPEEIRGRHGDLHAHYLADPAPRPMAAGLDLEARRADGERAPVEIALVPLADPAGWVAAFVRDIRGPRLLQDRLAIKGELIAMMAGDADEEALRQRFGALLLAAVHADGVWVTTSDWSGGPPACTAIDPLGVGCDGRRLRDDPRLAGLSRGGTTVIELPAPAGAEPGRAGRRYAPALAAAVRSDDGSLRGGVAVTRSDDRPGFDQNDRLFLVEAVAILESALDLADARSSRIRLNRMLDRERIARDLHDSVIQRLFAEGLRLEATAEIATGTVRDRLLDAAADLDAVIGDIRAAIFELHPPAWSAGGLREEVLAVAAEIESSSGLDVQVSFDGAVDASVSGPVAESLLLVVREGLTNVVKHAVASSARVSVGVEREVVTLAIVDDGHGLLGGESGGFGIDNLRARAAVLGGTCRLGPRADGPGSELRWTVPLDR